MAALASDADISSALAYGVPASKWAVESDSNVSSNLDHLQVAGESFFPMLALYCVDQISNSLSISKVRLWFQSKACQYICSQLKKTCVHMCCTKGN